VRISHASRSRHQIGAISLSFPAYQSNTAPIDATSAASVFLPLRKAQISCFGAVMPTNTTSGLNDVIASSMRWTSDSENCGR
jgi:hypothetical protein